MLVGGIKNGDQMNKLWPAAFVLFFVFSSGFSAGVFAQGSTNPVPFINQPLVPVSAAPAGSAFTLTINGGGFFSTSTVNWNGGARPDTFYRSTKLKATAPPSAQYHDA